MINHGLTYRDVIAIRLRRATLRRRILRVVFVVIALAVLIFALLVSSRVAAADWRTRQILPVCIGSTMVWPKTASNRAGLLTAIATEPVYGRCPKAGAR